MKDQTQPQRPFNSSIAQRPFRHGKAQRFIVCVILGWVVVRGAYVLSDAPFIPAAVPGEFERPNDGASSAAFAHSAMQMPRALQAQDPNTYPAFVDHAQAFMSVTTPLPYLSLSVFSPKYGDANMPNQNGAFLKWPAPADRFAAYHLAQDQDIMVQRLSYLARAAPTNHAVGIGAPMVLDTDNRGTQTSEYVTAHRPMRRISMDLWALYRPKNNTIGTASLAPAAQYGGAQAGARIGYGLDSQNNVAAFLRLSRLLRSANGAEAAVGISIRPISRLPIHLAVERRIALDAGARNAMAAYISGGYGPQQIATGPAKGMQIETYGQAGVVGVHRRALFAEGMARIAKPVPLSPSTQIAVGAATWGGAQTGVSRMDIGPQVQLQGKSGDTPFRVSVDWRERIVGNAQPGSGVAITLVAGF